MTSQAISRAVFKEGAAIADVFEIHQDNIGVRIIFQIAQQFDFADIGLVAKADKFGEANVASFSVIKHGPCTGRRIGK